MSGAGGWGTADTAFGVSPVFGSLSGGLGNGLGLPSGLGSIGLGGAGGGGLRGGGGGLGGGGLEAVPGLPGAGLPVGLGGLGFPTVSGSAAGGDSVGSAGDGSCHRLPLIATPCHSLPLVVVDCRATRATRLAATGSGGTLNWPSRAGRVCSDDSDDGYHRRGARRCHGRRPHRAGHHHTSPSYSTAQVDRRPQGTRSALSHALRGWGRDGRSHFGSAAASATLGRVAGSARPGRAWGGARGAAVAPRQWERRRHVRHLPGESSIACIPAVWPPVLL